jgi:predicted negative regulator of RcsB-dependent stress response
MWQMGEGEAALRTLSTELPEPFRPLAEELKGDIHLAAGARDQARAAYDAALAMLALKGQDGGLLRMKRDELGAAAGEDGHAS